MVLIDEEVCVIADAKGEVDFGIYIHSPSPNPNPNYTTTTAQLEKTIGVQNIGGLDHSFICPLLFSQSSLRIGSVRCV